MYPWATILGKGCCQMQWGDADGSWTTGDSADVGVGTVHDVCITIER